MQKEEGRQEEVMLLDISPGGMRVLLNDDINVGSSISGQFKIIPDGGPFYVQGEVIWVRPVVDKIKHSSFEVGIKFTKVSTISL